MCDLPSSVTFTSETIRRKQFQSKIAFKYDHNLVSRWSHNDISTSPLLSRRGGGEGRYIGEYLEVEVRNACKNNGVGKRRTCGTLSPHPSSFLQVVRLYQRLSHVIYAWELVGTAFKVRESEKLTVVYVRSS